MKWDAKAGKNLPGRWARKLFSNRGSSFAVGWVYEELPSYDRQPLCPELKMVPKCRAGIRFSRRGYVR